MAGRGGVEYLRRLGHPMSGVGSVCERVGVVRGRWD